MLVYEPHRTSGAAAVYLEHTHTHTIYTRASSRHTPQNGYSWVCSPGPFRTLEYIYAVRRVYSAGDPRGFAPGRFYTGFGMFTRRVRDPPVGARLTLAPPRSPRCGATSPTQQRWGKAHSRWGRAQPCIQSHMGCWFPPDLPMTMGGQHRSNPSAPSRPAAASPPPSPAPWRKPR